MIGKIALSLVFLLTFFNTTFAQGEPYKKITGITGNQYFQWCNSVDELGLCIGYTMGISDGVALKQIPESPKEWPPICVPSNVNIGQKKDVILKYLSDHPAERHEALLVLAIVAWRTAWPCY